jgi:hypothetical protein
VSVLFTANGFPVTFMDECVFVMPVLLRYLNGNLENIKEPIAADPI